MYDDDIKLDIIRDDSYNIDVHRTITVRKYETDIKCDLDAVEDLLGSNYLKHGKEFGCINQYPRHQPTIDTADFRYPQPLS